MENSALVIAMWLGGLVAPFIINLLKQPHWSSTQKLWLAMGVSLVIALVAMLGTGALAGAPVRRSATHRSS